MQESTAVPSRSKERGKHMFTKLSLYPILQYFICSKYVTILFSSESPEPLPHLVMDLDLLALNKALKEVWQVASLPNGQALVYHKSHANRYICKIDEHGARVDPFYESKGKGARIIRGLITDDTFVYILYQNGTVSKCDIKNLSESVETFKIDGVESLRKGVKIESKLILADHSGEIFSYDLEKKKKRIILSGLKGPSCVAYFSKEEKTIFAVCEFLAGSVTIFNSSWNKTASLQLDQLHSESAVFSVSGTLLVADENNNRVSEFNQAGRFLRHLIAEEDGIKGPVSISCNYPYIWVVGNSGNNVKRFKLV